MAELIPGVGGLSPGELGATAGDVVDTGLGGSADFISDAGETTGDWLGGAGRWTSDATIGTLEATGEALAAPFAAMGRPFDDFLGGGNGDGGGGSGLMQLLLPVGIVVAVVGAAWVILMGDD